MTDIIIQGIGGRMGHVLCEMIAQRADCRVIAGIDQRDGEQNGIPVYDSLDKLEGKGDVIIDFSSLLMCESDEIQYTLSEEITFINSHNESKEAMLILAFVDGKYAGNCSFEGKFGSRRVKHRAGIGIALYQKYTGFGLGRLMLNCLLNEIETAGYEQAELTVVEGNDRAYRLYQSLGFNECGRIPHANKYDDGTYGGEILMVKNL